MPRRSASQVELPLGLEAHRNTALFSDHYLAERLPQLPWFTDRRGTASRAAYDAIRAVYDGLRPEEQLPGAPEEQVEDDLVRPILDALGHHYLLRPPTTAGGTKNFPDYALFKNAEDRNAARTEVSANDYSRAVALCEAKHWDRDLDRSGPAGRDYLTNANPSFQIVNYLIQTGRRWGILTNGRLWRLYCRDSPQPLERFYEVDLPRLISQSGADAFFTYFFGFFSAEALRPVAGGLAHVDNVRAGTPLAAGVLEIPDQLLLLGVDRDQGDRSAARSARQGARVVSRLARDPQVEAVVAAYRADLETAGQYARKEVTSLARAFLLRVGVDGWVGLSLEQQLAVRGHDRRLVAWLIVTGRVRPTVQYLIASRLRGRTRAEALNNNVKRIVRRAYGFHSARAALALIHLTCGPVPLALSRERTFA